MIASRRAATSRIGAPTVTAFTYGRYDASRVESDKRSRAHLALSALISAFALARHARLFSTPLPACA